MLIVGFLLVGTALNLVLGFLVQFKSYRKSLSWTLLGLSALFATYLWIAYLSVFSDSTPALFRYARILQALGILISLGILELTRQFLRGSGSEPHGKRRGWRDGLFLGVLAGSGLGLALLGFSGKAGMSWAETTLAPAFEGASMFVPALRVLVSVYTLYVLESTYRYAQDYQRRIARLGFIGLGSLAIFHIVYFAKVLIYRTLPDHFPEASSVIYAVGYPVILAGFLRYRLGSERITVPRDTVYSSATVFLTGSAFLGVTLTIFAFRWLRIDFSYFERFLLIFSLCFLAVLVLGSGTMRRQVTRWVNEQIFTRKYDYQDQFFRLHESVMSGADVDGALTGLVENMKYSVTVNDAYFFILNWQDGNFYQHENKEEATRRGLTINGDSALARLLAREGAPVDLLATDSGGEESRKTAAQDELVAQLGFDALFPIQVSGRLAAILALQGGRIRPFDGEDLDLIAVFTNSIGDVLFKNRMQKERIAQKQFESFHHVSAFIIHDIKNQIATLSLLLRNAEKNLGNPSFQASMLNSVKSCAGSLQSLIDRLAVIPKQEELEPEEHPLGPVLEEVASDSALPSLSGLEFTLRSEGDSAVAIDRKALFFVVKNLVTNALEAMGGQGKLGISYGPLSASVPPKLRTLFGGGERFFSGYGGYVLVEDSGSGMDPDFVRRRLFEPFATTKEKGVGIGLYQCKTLVEKMGGRILCHSEPGKGTEFCILLARPKAAPD
ncbi:MAG: ATP-binding protein [Fibrobacteria bacterium]